MKKNIMILLSLSEDTQTSFWHRSWWTNSVVLLYPGLPLSRGRSHGKTQSFLDQSSLSKWSFQLLKGYKVNNKIEVWKLEPIFLKPLASFRGTLGKNRDLSK